MLRSKISHLNLHCFKLNNSTREKLRSNNPTLNSTFNHNKFLNNKSQNIEIRSIASKSKYNKPPPIDLKSIRTRNETSKNTQESNSKASYGLILLGLPLLSFGLGVWQIYRREWKLEMIKFLEDRTKQEPRELPTTKEELDKLAETSEFCPFKVKGRFIHSKEILLSPKSDITGTNHLPGGLIITPFVVSNKDGLTILVNRGYVPYTNYSPLTRKNAQIEDEVEIVGLLRTNEIINRFTPVNKPPNEWHFREIETMAKTLDTAPIYLDATKASTIKGGPIGGQSAINLRNEHTSYIFTWFTLSFLTTIIWWKKFGIKLTK